MKKKVFIKFAVVLVVLAVITGLTIPVIAAENFKTNLTNLQQISGEWSIEENGYRGICTSGDGFAMSDTVGTNFTYEAKVHRNEGIAFSLVFRSNETGSKAYVANIDFTRNTARIFYFNDGNGGDIGQEYNLPDIEKLDFKLKVEAKGNSLKYYVDDVLAVSATNDLFDSGFFGLLIFNGDGVYQDLYYTEITDNDTSPDTNGTDKTSPDTSTPDTKGSKDTNNNPKTSDAITAPYIIVLVAAMGMIISILLRKKLLHN